MRSNRLLRGTASLAVLAAFAAGSAYAQDEQVQEVIVTAQKREQNLQDVPVVVTSLSETVLENAGVRDIKDLQILTPGLTVTSTSNESVTTARIRGVGTVGDNPGLESSVGVVIDGVYRPRNGVGFGDLGELQRIEVLKGPQGTLFGKNTSSGVINIISEAPAFERGLEAELTAGDYGAWGAALSLTGGLTDNLAGRLYVAGRQRDGFYDVITGAGPRSETDDQNQDFMTVRGQLLFLPADNAEIRVIADYTDRSERCCVAVQTRTGPTGALVDAFDPVSTGVAPVARPFDRIAYANRSTDQDITDQGISMEANVDLASWNATFTSITAFRSWETANAQDTDFSTADIWYREKDDNTVEFETFSQEFRLAGESYDGRLNWLVGAFYAQEDLTRRDRILAGGAYEAYWSNIILNNLASFASRPAAAGGLGSVGTALALLSQSGTTFVSESTGIAFGSNWVPGSGFTDQYDQSSTTLALFTNNSFQVTDRLEVTLGLRYTMDEKDVTSSYANDGFTGCSYMLGLGGGLGAAGLSAEFTDRGVAAPFIPTLVAIATGTACLTGSNTLFNGSTVNQSSDDNEWSGTAKAVYRFNDSLMTYVSYARGYKGGGFNLDRTQSNNGLPTGGSGVVPVGNTSFPAEFVDSYELGAKMTLMGGSVLLNATLFNQIYEDFQLNTFLGTTFVVESIPEVTSRGVDADLIWFSPIDGLDFQGGVTFARTEYGNFTAADMTNPSRFIPLSLLPGSNVSFAPEWSWSGSANYERELGSNMRVMGSLSAKYTTDYNTKSDLLPSGLQNSYALLNGRIGIGSADERWTLEVWGQNLTDEEYYQVVFNAPLQGSAFPTNIPSYNTTYDSQTYNAFLGQPRTWGATLRIKY